MNILESRDLKKYYYAGTNEVKAVDGITLEIEKGDFASIMGPSGSGKSTFLYLLGALEAQSEGVILIDGEKINLKNDKESSKFRRKKIGFIFQNYNLIPNFTVKENILIPILLDGKNMKTKEAEVKKLLSYVGLSDKENMLASKLSGGQQQRVAIARALINEPDLILADEPTGSLDSKSSSEIMELLQKLNQDGKTIVQVTHSQEAARYSKTIIVIKDGKMISKEKLN